MADKKSILNLIKEVNDIPDKAKKSLVETLVKRNIEPTELSIIGIPDDVNAVALIIYDRGLLILKHKRECQWV